MAEKKKSFGDIVSEAIGEAIPAVESFLDNTVDAILDGVEEFSRVIDGVVEEGVGAIDDLIDYGERALESACDQLTAEWFTEQDASQASTLQSPPVKPKKAVEGEKELSKDPRKRARQISARKRQVDRAKRYPVEQLEVLTERLQEVGGYGGRETSKLTRQINADLEASRRRVAERAREADTFSQQQASIAEKKTRKANKASNPKSKGSKKGKSSGSQSGTKKGVH